MKLEEILSSLDEQAASALAKQLLERLDEAASAAQSEDEGSVRGGEGSFVWQTGFDAGVRAGAATGFAQGSGATPERLGEAFPFMNAGHREFYPNIVTPSGEARAVLGADVRQEPSGAGIEAAGSAASGGRSPSGLGGLSEMSGGLGLRPDIGAAAEDSGRGGYYELFEAQTGSMAAASDSELTERLSESVKRDARRYDTPYDRY
ncbi:MAG: hypothetical protein LBM18_00820 [Oscillospiraceae bacterium]|jgi:hypothetical protein|nr:hypothetical protein [Oscillospiraceae bacterium]